MRWILMVAMCVACSSKETGERHNDKSDDAPQSFQEGMQALCDSVDKVANTSDPSERQRRVAQWIGTHVTNSEVRELFTILGDMPPSQRADMIRAAAAKASIKRCAIAGP